MLERSYQRAEEGDRVGDRSRLTTCMRLLLEAGADPLIQHKSDDCSFSALRYAIRDSDDRNTIDAILNSQVGLMDANYEVEVGKPLLNYYLEYAFYPPQKETINLLVKMGANVHALDKDGGSCLHALVNRLYKQRPYLPCPPCKGRDALVALLQAGIDVRVANVDGLTASDLIYKNRLLKNKETAGMVSDIWDAALTKVRYEASDFRRGTKREPQYSNSYTPYHYKALMMGEDWGLEDDERWAKRYNKNLEQANLIEDDLDTEEHPDEKGNLAGRNLGQEDEIGSIPALQQLDSCVRQEDHSLTSRVPTSAVCTEAFLEEFPGCSRALASTPPAQDQCRDNVVLAPLRKDFRNEISHSLECNSWQSGQSSSGTRHSDHGRVWEL